MPVRPAPLAQYRAKRNFRETPEPAAAAAKPHPRPIFVVQEHHATRLHYDFRLEADGVLKSWAVTKEPSLDPAVKRLAVRVEDHPLGYATFEGTIPAGQYGAGQVRVWDAGTFENLDATTLAAGLAAGRLSIRLDGKKLAGRFSLVRMGEAGEKEKWLLIKGRDEAARRDPPAAKPPTPARGANVAPASRPPRTVPLTNGEKLFFPAAGVTKSDLVAYYRAVAPRLLPFLENRPVTLQRAPDGVGEGRPLFWQKHTPDAYPSWVPRVELETDEGKPVKYVLVNDRATLLFLANQGAVTFHPWLSRVDRLDRPDVVLFDLDPGAAAFADAVAVAHRLREELNAAGRAAAVKTSGKTGLHVLVPWDDGGYDEARAWASEVAGRVAAALPAQATTEMRKAKRGSRVYIDVLQNARGHHAVPPYVVRAVPGATASTPLTWAELTPDLDPAAFTVLTVPPRLARLRRNPLALLLDRG